jgi:hypothetical protein
VKSILPGLSRKSKQTLFAQPVLLTLCRPDRIYRVQRLQCDENNSFESSSPFVATICSEIAFLMPSRSDAIAVMSVPCRKQMAINHLASESDTSTILELLYARDEGDRYMNGNKSALHSLTMTFCDEETMDAFEQAVQDTLIEKPAVKELVDEFEEPRAPNTPRKQSFAMMNMSSASADEHTDDGRSTAGASPDVSPLRDRSLRLHQTSQAIGNSDKAPASHLPKIVANAAQPSPSLAKIPEAIQRPEPSSFWRSNQAKKRSRPIEEPTQDNVNVHVEQISDDQDTSQHTMARPTGPANEFQTSTTSKTGLKRRIGKDPTPAQDVESQKQSNTGQAGIAEYDLPSSGEDHVRLLKKTKTQSSKLATKTRAKLPVVKKKSKVQVGASLTEKKKESQKSKGKASQFKPAPATAATNRTRRAAKTPKYIDRSDEASEEEEAEQEEQELADKGLDDSEEDAADDSHPPDNATLDAVMKATQEQFESQLLPEMLDRESTDDEQRSKPELANNSTTQADIPNAAALNQPVLVNQKQLTTDNIDFAGSEKLSVPAIERVQNSLKMGSNHNDTPGRRISEKQTGPSDATTGARDAPLPVLGMPTQEQPGSSTIPQRGTDRLSETSIPPTSAKLLRKTPIVHFGPQGPANQGVLNKAAPERARSVALYNSDDVSIPGGPSDHDDGIRAINSLAHQFDTGVDNTTAGDGVDTEPFEMAPTREGTTNSLDDDPIPEPESEIGSKEPEIEETQPRSAEEFSDNDEETAGPGPLHGQKVQSLHGSDDEGDGHGGSAEENSDDHEASEYVVSHDEVDASIQPQDIPAGPPRERHSRKQRAETPLLEDDEPVCGYQKVREVSRHQAPARPSTSVNTIIDEDHPQDQRTIKARNLKPSHQGSRVPPMSEPEGSRTIQEPGKENIRPQNHGIFIGPARVEPPRQPVFRGSTLVSDVVKAKLPSVAPSVPPEEGTSMPRNFPVQFQKASTRSHQPVATSWLKELQRTSNNFSNGAIQPQCDRGDSRDMTVTKLRATVKHAMPPPPPPPPPLPSRVTHKHDAPRKSYPELHAEEAARVERTLPDNSRPVRVKKRHTLPKPIFDPISESELPPGTPASFSTRLDFHGHRTILDVENREDQGENGSHMHTNGNKPLVAENEMSLEPRSARWTRLTHTLPLRNDSDSSEHASPSPSQGSSKGTQHIAGQLDARNSQRGIAAALVEVTNVSPPNYRFSTLADLCSGNTTSLRCRRGCYQCSSR